VAVQRFDVGRLDAIKRTPQGGIVAPAFVTRSGVFEYAQPDGSVVREYRSPEEVGRADSLASLVAAPLTKLHPPKAVDPKNYREYSVGHLGESVKQDGNKIAATLYVQDADAVKAVEGGMRQVSCGYTCDVADEPGMTADGQSYDRVQRNISYNHVALVPIGRAGSEVALRLDAADNQVPLISPEKIMKVERIDGVEYEVGSEQHKAAIASRDEIAKLKSEQSKLQARADIAEADGKKLAAEVAELKSPARFDAAVAERALLIEQAKKLAGADFKADGLDADKIRAAALAKAEPTLRLDGKDASYIAAAFDLSVAKAPQNRADEVARVAAGVASGVVHADSEDEPNPALARARMIERNRELNKAKA
jgi:hypothetical protein